MNFQLISNVWDHSWTLILSIYPSDAFLWIVWTKLLCWAIFNINRVISTNISFNISFNISSNITGVNSTNISSNISSNITGINSTNISSNIRSYITGFNSTSISSNISSNITRVNSTNISSNISSNISRVNYTWKLQPWHDSGWKAKMWREYVESISIVFLWQYYNGYSTIF